MSRIVVIGGTGYAGSAIVAEAAARGHEVTALSRSLPADRIEGVDYIQGDATDETTLASVIWAPTSWWPRSRPAGHWPGPSVT